MTSCNNKLQFPYQCHNIRIVLHEILQQYYVSKISCKQECIPVGCVLPARYCMGRGGCLTQTQHRDPPGQRPPRQRPPDRDPLGRKPPGQKTPWTETPSGRHPPRQRPIDRNQQQRPPGQRSPGQRLPGQRPPWTETPLDRNPQWTETPWTKTQRPPWSCDLRCMLGQRPPLRTESDTCKNITLPQLRCER